MAENGGPTDKSWYVSGYKDLVRCTDHSAAVSGETDDVCALSRSVTA
jgi:hypothetical protein